jgi:hypothetical protein
MIDKATIVAQIESRIKSEVDALETKIDAKLNELILPCSVHIGKASAAAVETITALYEGKGKWTVEVYEEQNETITLTFS